MAGDLRPRWGQPLTGIISLITFFLIAWFIWFLLSDPRGPVGSFPYPFVMYLAMMILVGLWQHMFLGDWPFQGLPQPARGIVQTVVNLGLTWIVIHVVFYRVLGLGLNFLSQSNLEALATAGQTVMPQGSGSTLTLEQLVNPAARFAERAVVTYVLIGFYSYPLVTIFFAKWPIRPSNLTQPQAGLAEIGWAGMLTFFFYVVLIVPFWGLVYGKVLGASYALNTPWWDGIAGFNHVHWVFGWWEWGIIILFMTANVWRMKPWTLIALPQPWKGLISCALSLAIAYALALICVNIARIWLPQELLHELAVAKPGGAELKRFLWYHSAEIAGFTLMPFLVWHHYLDDTVPMKDKDSWAAFWYRTAGVLVFAAIGYWLFYYAGFGHWGLGNHHMEHHDAGFLHGESLIWNFWLIIPLLWNEWFFHKWPFYVQAVEGAR